MTSEKITGFPSFLPRHSLLVPLYVPTHHCMFSVMINGCYLPMSGRSSHFTATCSPSWNFKLAINIAVTFRCLLQRVHHTLSTLLLCVAKHLNLLSCNSSKVFFNSFLTCSNPALSSNFVFTQMQIFITFIWSLIIFAAFMISFLWLTIMLFWKTQSILKTKGTHMYIWLCIIIMYYNYVLCAFCQQLYNT